MCAKKAVKIRNGYSDSLWKSLVIKSLRLGWPAGLEAANRVLPPSIMKHVLVRAILEDVFPASSDVSQIMEQAAACDFVGLCSWQTHHGRGYTRRYMQLIESANMDERDESVVRTAMKKAGISAWLSSSMLKMACAWLAILPRDAGLTRSVDMRPWEGMPRVMADGHTVEGMRAGKRTTLLSGSYEQHENLAWMVRVSGWEAIRDAAWLSRTFERGVSETELMASPTANKRCDEKHPQVDLETDGVYTVHGEHASYRVEITSDGKELFAKCSCRAVGIPCYPAVAALRKHKDMRR